MVSISPKPDAHNEKQTFLLPPELAGMLKEITVAFDQAGYQVSFDDDVAHKLGQSLQKCLKDAQRDKLLPQDDIGVFMERLNSITGRSRKGN